MAEFVKLPLSASTHGRPIPVAQTSGTGTTIHVATANTGTGEGDEVWIYATNIDASPVDLGIQFGGTSDGDHIHVTVPAQGGGPLRVVPGIPLRNGLSVTATASVANDVNLFGYVNRIST